MTATHQRIVTQRIETREHLAAAMGLDWLFSEEQFAAITAPLEPTVVIAGAGSGKTAVMAARVVWLVVNELATPEQILGLTFTSKAAGELQQRVRSALRAAGRLPADSEEPTVSTYHAYAADLLTEHGLRIGHEPDARLIADASRYQLAARAIARYSGRVDQLTDHPATVIQNLLTLDGELNDHLVTPAEVRAYDARQRAKLAEADPTGWKSAYESALSAIDRRAELLGLVEEYRALKRRLGLIDFSDQISLTARLAEEHPAVGAAEREKFAVVLLDEYQDTSVAQARMLRSLFSGPTPETGLGHPVMAVGDPNQAIYGWRGASVSNITGFYRDFPPAGAERERLSLATSRRSDVAIVETANHLARPLYEQNDIKPLRPSDDAGPGEVRVAVHETYHDELDWLAAQVADVHRQGTPWKEIGVLVRTNQHAADVYDALVRREIPVEIVGLSGLLRLPEVAEVLATLTLLDDVTANSALLTLLTGPRWAIGPRDLALLGRRARELSRSAPREETYVDVRDQLAAAVASSDPHQIVALSDALEDPGALGYSPEARERFALLAAELRRLRQASGEPILDLIRRIIDVTGIDIELASAVSPAAQARRDNLDLFVQAVSEFQALDGHVTLSALLAWLQAEDEFGQGLDVATPSEADSVKLLTSHRAKGLEWDVVFVPGVTLKRFPVDRLRSSHLSSPQVLPVALRGDAVDLPDITEYSKAGYADWDARRRAHAATEELRLAYVTWTRPRHRLFASAWCWAPRLVNGAGPSPYLETMREAMSGEPDSWIDPVPKGEPSPYDAASDAKPWPIDHHTPEVDRRIAAARLVAEAGDLLPLDPGDAALVATWDEELERLLAELAADEQTTVVVPRPSTFSATAVARLRDDPEEFAKTIARPMPRRPSTAARFGTRFHAWVEQRFGQEGLFDPDELPGQADAGIEDDADLHELIAAFEAGPFASRAPLAVEAPFALVLAESGEAAGARQVVRGRIDAVYTDGDGYLVVDWKTGRSEAADPLQLAIYRLAWADLAGVPVEQVRAAFYYVRTGRLAEPSDLPNRHAIAALLGTP